MVFKFSEHPSVNLIEDEFKKEGLTCENFKKLLEFVIEEYICAKDEIMENRPNSHSFAVQMAARYREFKDNQEYNGISDKVVKTIFEIALVIDRGMGFGRSVERDKKDARWQADMVRLINQYINDPSLPELIEESWHCFDTKFWDKSDVEPIISGVKGVVTATHLLRELNLDLRLSTPDEDVEHKVDLWAFRKKGVLDEIFAFQIKTSKYFDMPNLRIVNYNEQEIINLKRLCKDLQYQLRDCEPEEKIEIKLELDVARSKVSLAEHMNTLSQDNPNIKFSAYWLSIPGYLGTGDLHMDTRTGLPDKIMKGDFVKNNIKVI